MKGKEEKHKNSDHISCVQLLEFAVVFHRNPEYFSSLCSKFFLIVSNVGVTRFMSFLNRVKPTYRVSRSYACESQWRTQQYH